ncbi:hypothetical protein Pmani_032110 [Petrolisthes manimaculis]|uniref:Uncharacterized protein n=1 Tax=Petrolisthes manimaculis TaxID=1843537 RepID=A0AAE1NU07_9EUCA|nr:hypothetical protein Pmani_032110 [Petrolisthes manimaculis]
MRGALLRLLVRHGAPPPPPPPPPTASSFTPYIHTSFTEEGEEGEGDERRSLGKRLQGICNLAASIQFTDTITTS